jgi:AraC-like DNA-binding protein
MMPSVLKPVPRLVDDVCDPHPLAEAESLVMPAPQFRHHYNTGDPNGCAVTGWRSYAMPSHRVRELVRLAARHGWDVRTAMADAGIEATCSERPYPALTLSRAAAAMRSLWLESPDVFLGLGPSLVSRETLGVLAFALANAPTLGDSLARLEQFAPVFAGMPRPFVSSMAGETTISFDLTGFDCSGSLVVDSVLLVTHRLMNWGIRRRIHLVHVEVPYERPSGEVDHDVIFGAPVRFGAPRAALTFRSDALTDPMVRRYEEVEDFLADMVTVLLSDIDLCTTHAQRVRSIVERCLGDHVCTADEIAAGMGISRQTLHRRLRQERTSVSTIRDDVLRTTALDSLSRGGETVAALAFRLGFSEPSAFTRAFRRWTGEAPTTFSRRRSA